MCDYLWESVGNRCCVRYGYILIGSEAVTRPAFGWSHSVAHCQALKFSRSVRARSWVAVNQSVSQSDSAFIRSFIHSFVRSFVCIVDVVSVFGCYAFNCALHSGLDVNNKARVRVCNCNIVNSPIHRAPPFRYCSLNVRSPRRYRHWKRPELPTCGLELSVCLPSCACVLVTAVFEKRKQTAEDLFVDWTSPPACGLAACKI